MKAPVLAFAALALAVPATAQTTGQTNGPTSGAALPGAPRARPVSEGPAEVAKGAPVNGVLVLYGNQRCPTDADGNEVVVCTRRPASEQFRVPKELRDLQITPENESWAARSSSTLNAGAGVNGIGSCSAVGAGGATGCFGQASRLNKRTNQARRAENVPVGQ